MQGPVLIGSYRLTRQIATAPTTTVWAALHGSDGRAVAVEIVDADALRDPEWLRAFRAGLRSGAALASPNIVHVYDAGTVDAVAARSSQGALVTGAPYKVMELCTGGTLDEIKRPYRWSELRAVLIGLLDALGHLHARGQVHRALQPQTVLLNGIDDERQGLKLAGLGQARRLDLLFEQGDFHRVGSLLHYVAPEQIRRRWRDLGPWTDLYSLGCLAWELASGQRPHRGARAGDLARAQLQDVLPVLRPRGPVPEGFERWLKRMTAKEPHRRFQRAADAAWALIRLGDVDEDFEPVERDALVVALDDRAHVVHNERSGRVDLNEIRAHLVQVEPVARFSTVPELTEGELRIFEGSLAPEVPPVPASWRGSVREQEWSEPRGTGLGLFDLRPLPLVDRSAERQQLWEAFRDVVQRRSARLVRVTGPAGIGKSAVARWLCERAHEIGAATVLRATHARAEPPGRGVRRMFQEHLRLAKLDRSAARGRVQDFLFQRGVRRIDEVEALTELLYPSTRVDAGTRRVSGVEERHAVVRRFFRLLALERPLIVWLEDAHWGNDALGLAHSVLSTQRVSPIPVLFVLTTRDEFIAERPVERALLQDIARLEGASELGLGPLADRDMQRLVQSVLGLEEALARQVVERTSGNPMLAVEIVRDWVHRGALEPTAQGFELAPGEGFALPDDLHAVWMRRVERVLRGLPTQAESFLEAAAVLGLDVDDGEWREVTDHPGGFHNQGYLDQGGMAFSPENARIRAKLADRLLDFRLAEETDTGWRFAHGMIREAVLRWARESGREFGHHRAAAAMLQRRWALGRRGVAERLGAHLEAAGRLEEAVDPMMAGVEERSTTLGVQPALALLARCEELMERLRLSESDPRWGRLWTMQSALALMRGDHDGAERWSRRALLAGSDGDWERWASVIHEARYHQAQLALSRGELSVSEQRFRELKSATVDADDPRWHALALYGLAMVARARGNGSLALVRLGEARRAFEQADDPIGIADCWEEMAGLDLGLGDVDSAESLYKRALDVFEVYGERSRMGGCILGLARVAEEQGRPADAESGYRHALNVFESVGSGRSLRARLAVAVSALQRGDHAEATELADQVRATSHLAGRRRIEGTAVVVLLGAAAAVHDWNGFAQCLEDARDLRRSTGFCDHHAAMAARIAGELALEAGREHEATDALRFAWYQYRGLADHTRMDALSRWAPEQSKTPGPAPARPPAP